MPDQGNLYALLIGINGYEQEAVRPLQFAVADVLAFKELLGERMGLDDQNCIVLTHPVTGQGDCPRRSDVLRALSR